MSTISDGIGDETGDIRHLFSYNIQRLAGLSSRIAHLTIGERFGLSTLDWRAMAVLDFLGIATLQVLASRAGVQKSQMSRIVSALEQDGMILRRDNPTDKRSVYLELSAAGKERVRTILTQSRARNTEMLRNLDEAERQQLMTLLDKVTRGSLGYLRELKGEADTPTIPDPASPFETEFR